MKLKGKTAIVTGGAKGIGFGIARRFVAEGAAVVIADVDAEAGARAADRPASTGDVVRAHATGRGQPVDVRRLVDETVAAFGRVDILVNNAGIGIAGPFLDLSLELWDRTIAVNLTGAFLCAQAAGRVMVRQRSGRIINIASINSFIA